MELNVTLFIQMINFFIAWFILRVLYFKPAIAFLDQQQEEHDQLIATLRRWQGGITLKEHEIAHVWSALKLFSKDHKPDSLHPDFFIFKDIAPAFEQLSVDKKQIDRLTKEVKQIIITEAAHVDI